MILIKKGDLVIHDGRMYAYLFRKKPGINNEVNVVRVNIVDAMTKVGSDQNLALEAFDSLVVVSEGDFTEAMQIEILGAVQKPGKFQYSKGLTVKDAISLSGGFNYSASSNRIEIFRIIIKDNQQHESLGQKSIMGYWYPEDGLHHGGRSMPGDAGQDRRAQAHHGVSGFRRQTQPDCRCRAGAPLGGNQSATQSQRCTIGQPCAGTARGPQLVWCSQQSALSQRGLLVLFPRASEICLAVSFSLGSQLSSNRPEGAEMESPATNLSWSS